MPNGKPGDHPLTDMLVHGMHPFPDDIEQLLRQILNLDPRFPDGTRPYVDQIEWARRFQRWERGKDLQEGRSALTAVLKELQAQSGSSERPNE